LFAFEIESFDGIFGLVFFFFRRKEKALGTTLEMLSPKAFNLSTALWHFHSIECLFVWQ
jgi:hypothetical protein